ncbi:MAG: ADOP family duplicated permease [Gemmatimonadales bacterium]
MDRERWRRYVLPTRTPLAADVDEELRSHIEMLVQDLVAGGVEPAAARAEAERRFGAVAPVRDACLTIDRRRNRRASLGGLMIAAAQDLRYVVRALRSAPGFSLVVTLTLALGIGVTTALVSVVDNVLLRPLPYADPKQLVALFDVQGKNSGFPASLPEYRDWAQRSGEALSDVGAWLGTGEVLSGSGDAEQIFGARITANVPALLGVTPVAGRTFRADEEAPGADRVVMLSEGMWRSHFGGDPGIIGRTITLTDKPYVVVGVYPTSARSVLPAKGQFARGMSSDFWLPLQLDEKEFPRGQHGLSVVGRMRAGLTPAQARVRLDAMAAGLTADGVTTHGLDVQPLDVTLVGDMRGPLTILLGAVGMLLVIACANVANLLLARGAARRHEFALRATLGAGRRRLIVLVLVESLARGVLGGACGIAVAYGLVYAGRQWLTTTIPRMSEVSINGPVLAFAFGMSIACGVLFGLVPALRAAREDPVGGLRDGGRGAVGSLSRDRVRRTLIVAEIALSFVLLASGGLLARSFWNLTSVPTGFDAEGLVSARTWLPPTRYPDSLAQLAFWDRLTRDLREATGADAIALTDALPVEGGANGDIAIEGWSGPDGTTPVAEKRHVSPNYFAVLRATITRGRAFESTDVLGTPQVVIVNQAFVDRWLPGEEPIGKRVAFGWGTTGMQTIAGVVADVREGALDKRPKPAVYISTAQRPTYFLNFVVRSTRPEREIAATLRRVLRGIDPALPLIGTRRVSEVLLASVRQKTLVAAILGTLALMALVLAAVGLYGVISYSVAQRKQEFGVRAALGAGRGELMRLVLRQSVGYTSAGLVLGVLGAIGGTRIVAGQLFGVASRDPSVFAMVGALLVAVVMVATAVPTVRAMRADPLEALRSE